MRPLEAGRHSHMRASDRVLYRRWIVANGWAESAGLGTTFVIGYALAPRLGQVSGVASVLGAAVLAVALGTLLEGILVGAAQERVLRRRLPVLRRGAWTLATAAGAASAWLLGMLPSTIAALAGAEASTTGEPGAVGRLGLATALGLVAGPILGLAQWTVLRGVVARAGRWLWANAIAWAIGMPLVFAGMDLVPWTGHPALVAFSLYALCGITGLAVGAVHGRVLLRLLESDRRILVNEEKEIRLHAKEPSHHADAERSERRRV